MIQEVKMYNAKCDTCGHEPDFGDFTCYGDRDSVRTDIHAQGWEITEDDHCYCDDCVKNRLNKED